MQGALMKVAHENRPERYARWRLVLLMSSVGFWFVWQLCTVVAQGGFVEAGRGLVETVGMATLVLAGLSFAALCLLGRRIKRDPVLGSALCDELSHANYNRAYRDGYFTVLALTGLMLGLSTVMHVPATQILQIVLMVAVVTPIARFVWLERSDSAVNG